MQACCLSGKGKDTAIVVQSWTSS